MARLGRGYTRPRYIRPIAASGLSSAATSLDATSTLTASAGRTAATAATLAATSTLGATAGVSSPASATLAASSTLTAGAVRTVAPGATLAAVSTLAATPGATGTATLTAVSGLTAGATQTRAATAVLAAVSTLSAPARQTFQSSATLAATSTLTASGSRGQPIAATLAATSSLGAAATPVRPAAAVLAAAALLTVGTVVRTAVVAATLAATSALTASAGAAAGGQLNLSLWAVDRANGNRRVPLPHHMKLTLADISHQAGTIAFDYPVQGKNFALLNRDVAGDSDLEVEVWLGGRASTAIRGYVNQRDGDDVSERGSVRFTGALTNHRFDQTMVEPQEGNDKKELVFAASTPGAAMLFLLAQAQARGALTDVTADFTALLDSDGVPWAETFSGKWSPSKTSYLQILQKLATLGLAEFELTAGKVWRLYNFGGRGANRTTGPQAVMLRRGRNVLEANRRASSREGGTTLFLDGSEGLFAQHTDPTALARRGRVVEVSASAGNIAEQSALNATAQQLGGRIGKGVTERTFGLAFGVGHPRPGVHFGVGDLVLTETGGVQGSERVAQIQLDSDAGGLSGSAVCGDLIADRAAALEARLAEQANGGVTVGTSTPTVEDHTPPGAPTDLIASSTAYQDEDAGETYARVDMGWQPPTLNGDGDNDPRVQAAELIEARFAEPEQTIEPDWTWPMCPQLVRDYAPTLLALYPGDPTDETASTTWLGEFIDENGGPSSAATDVEGYQIRYAYLGLYQVGGIPSSEPWNDNLLYRMATPEGGVRGTSYSFGGVGAGVAVRAQVRAFDRSANFGAWSAPIDFDTAVDVTPPPQLAAPTGRIWFRTLDVTTSFVGSAGEPMPFDTDHVEVWLSQAAVIDVPEEASSPVQFDAAVTTPQHVANLGPSAGTWNQPDLNTGVGWYAALRAVDRAGNASPLSTIAGPFTAERLVGDDLINGIIDATKLGPNSVQTLHIVDGAMTSAKILDAAIVRAKIANLAVNDAKIEDLQVGKVTTGTLVATVTLTGLIRTAPSGLRWEGDPAGIRMFNASGVKTIDLRGDSGSGLFTGTLQSALSGERWMMDPSGELRLYPAAGPNFSLMKNLGSDLMLRGPLDANNRSGRINVNSSGLGLNFSAESEIPNNLRSEVIVFDRYTRTTAPVIELRVDGRYSTVDGFERRVLIKQTDGSGNDIGASTMHWLYITGGSGPAWLATQRDIGIKFSNEHNNNDIGFGRLYVTDAAGGAFRSLQCSVLIESSSERGKAGIRGALAALAQDRASDVIAAVRARAWVRRPKPGEEPLPGARPQFGLVAEELAAVAPELVDGADGPPEQMGISPMAVAALAWEGVNETRADFAALLAKLNRLPAFRALP